jgi:multiple sugar transport system permease protein/raffinose/stachyose/melibiose transport system permease protein
MKSVTVLGGTTIRHAALLLWGAVSVVPLVYMLSASLQSNQEIYQSVHLIPHALNWDNYTQAWQQASFGMYFGNSVFYTVTIVAGTLVIGTASAYAFARLTFPGKNLTYFLFLVFLVVPIPGVFIPLYVLLVKLHLVNTRLGYILPMINSNLPVAIFILRSFFEDIPRELEESALIDGAGVFRTYRSIALPLAMPAIATVTIFTALGTWNEFLFALIVFSKQSLMPLQVGLMTFQGTYFSQYSLMMAATAITTVPIVVLYFCMQKYIIKGVMAGALKG